MTERTWDGGLDAPETYDRYVEGGCPECGADLGQSAMFWWCDDGHFGMVRV